MPLSVNFRWKTPALATPKSDAEKNNLNENLVQLGDAISRMRASRYNKAQTARKNAIEDENRAIAAEDRAREIEEQERKNAIEDENRAIAAEDRAREIEEQERRKKAYGEAADIMRGRSAERERLLQERASIVAQINGLKQRMGL